MARTYSELYYHLVWSTRDREPKIMPHLEPELFGYIRAKCREMGVVVYALGGVEDHIHLACSIPVSLAVSAFMHRVKGASSHHVNQMFGGGSLYWQSGYGVLTFAKRDLKRVVDYIERQKEHHRQGTLSPKMELTGPDEPARDPANQPGDPPPTAAASE